jgi:hypothetical protein
MEDICPNCGKPLTTKTISKKMSQGVIEYPIAKICPKCKWNTDLTGAGHIISERVMIRDSETKTGKTLKPIAQTGIRKESQLSSRMNFVIVLVLVGLVIGGFAYAFFLQGTERPLFVQNSTPGVDPKYINATPEIPIQEDTVVPTGKKWPVLLDYNRGFVRNNDLTIKLGDEVVWDNINTLPVTLISKDDLFGNVHLDYGKHESFMFKKPGVYDFYLENNRNMTGTITVIKP